MGADSRPLRLACYGFAVSLSSAILLRLEITAGRLIAPCVGVTLYSWASIFGVIPPACCYATKVAMRRFAPSPAGNLAALRLRMG